MNTKKRNDLKKPSWQYDFRLKGKRYRKAGFLTKKAAELAGNEKLSELQNGGVANTEIIFESYYLNWLKVNSKSRLSDRQYYWYTRSLDLFNDYFGEGKTLKTITRADFQLFLNNYGEGRTTESVRKVSQCIGACLRDAVYDGYIPKDPTYKVKPEGTVMAKREGEKFFTIDQYERLIEHFKSKTSRSYIMLHLIAITGARFSEVNNMTWHDLNKAPGFVHLPGSKSESAERDVEVDTKSLLSIKAKLSDAPIPISGKLFGLSHNAITKSIKKAQKDLNIPEADFKTTHALRHTHCSYLISKGIPIEYISKRLGHSSISITLDVYSHLLDEHRAEQGERVRKLFK